MALPDLREALVHLEQGNSAEAVRMLEPLAERSPAYAAAHALLARAYEEAQRPEAARRMWQAAHFLMPNSPVVQEGLRRTAGAASGRTSSPSRAEASEAGVEAAPAQQQADEEPRFEQHRSAPLDTGDLLSEIERRAEAEERIAAAEDVDDLQHLIDELQSARIEPSPEMDDLPAPELDQDIEDMVSETLARIYAAQDQFGEAANVYVQLARQHPDRADEFEEKAAQMRQKAAEED